MAWCILSKRTRHRLKVVALQIISSANGSAQGEHRPLVRLEALGWDGESHIKTMKMKAMIAPVFK
jgi:hypothetical protein